MTREVILVGVVCLLCIVWVVRKKRLQKRRASVAAAKAQVAHALRPRTPEDCPECQEATPGAEEGNTTRAGLHAEQVQAQFFHGLSLGHVQLDELKTKVRQSSNEVWVWLGVEAHSKLIPVIQIGPRTQDMAYAVCACLGGGVSTRLHPGVHE